MPLPDITHLQFLLLTALLEGERSGRELRECLAKEGQRKSAPAFYQVMARLEDARFVEGWYEQKLIDGQAFKERRYKLTGPGLRAWEEVRDFYLRQAERHPRPGLAGA
jgi:DNA-binding PadR family transcriptional regulator